MEIAKLVLEYWKASVWPLVLVIAVLVFRDQIRDALKRAKAFDAMGVTVELAEVVDEAQEALAEVREEAGSPASDGRQVASTTSIETAQRARKALEEIRSVSGPTGALGDSAVPFVISFRVALQDTAEAFGREAFDYRLAEHLVRETGLTGWSVLVDLRRLLTRLAADQQGSRRTVGEMAMISQTAKQARITLKSLLEHAAGESDERAGS